MTRAEYPQAIAFDTNFGVIMQDKDVWLFEIIVVKRGDYMGEMLYDESVNWEDDPRRTRPPTTSFVRRFKGCSEPVFTMEAVDVGAAATERNWASSPPSSWLLLHTNRSS